MPECLFCRIAAGEIPAQIVYQDDRIVAFRDLNPQAPVHLLLIPRRHIPNLAASEPGDAVLLGELLVAAARLAVSEGVSASGYRVVANTHRDAGQSVDHLHFHLLGARALSWPPG
jgi:histidine triad (HIT) family protein